MWFIYFVFGAVFGSAANALIDRLPKNISWTMGRSMCDSCGHELKIKDLVPLISYLSLIFNKFQTSNHKSQITRSKYEKITKFYQAGCRYCHSPIPGRNFLLEMWMSVGFVFINWHLSFGIGSVLLSFIFWVTTIIAVMDWETKLVSDWMVIMWGILVISWQLSVGSWQLKLLFGDLIGLLVGVGLIGGLWLFSKGRAMGSGDIGIAAVMGWWLGWPNVVVGMWMAFVLGAVYGVIMLIKRSSTLRSEVAFGPWLVLGSWIGLLYGEKIVKLIIK